MTGSRTDYSRQIWLQPDGKVIVCGYQRNSPFDYPMGSVGNTYAYQILTVIRYNSNGSLDPSFGIGGKFRFATGISNANFYYPISVLQPDGKILISTSLLNADSTALDFAVYRISTDGHLDSTFGTNGLVRKNIDSTHNVNVSIFVLPDGKIIQAGFLGCPGCSYYTRYLVMVKYDENGKTDSTYGINGVVDSIRTNGFGLLVMREPNKFLIVNNLNPYLVPINADGSYDNTYRAYTNQINGGLALVQKCLPSTDGVFLGYDIGYGPGPGIGLFKMKTNGNIDSTFGVNGFSETTLLRTNIVKSIAVQPDHKVLLLTQSAYYDTSFLNHGPTTIYKACAAVTRFQANGRIDSSFGINGTFLLDTLLADQQTTESMIVQPDGKILVAGHGTTVGQVGILVFRLLNELNVGILDFDDKSTVMQVYPNPIHNQATLKYELIENENVSISLYDMAGQKAQDIIPGEAQAKGSHAQAITIRQNTSPGNYILRMSTGKGSSGVKIVID